LKVELELPKGLFKFMQLQAVLFDMTVEQVCVNQLKESTESLLDSDGLPESIRNAYHGKKRRGRVN
jgi:hypothetical protein